MKTICPCPIRVTRMALMPLVASALMTLLPSNRAWAALPDPTRPPPGLATAPGAGTGVVMGITAPPPSAPPRATPPATSASAPRPPMLTPRVQALHHPLDAPAGSASALIDGRLLRVGDRLGDAWVQEIRPDGVWLRQARGGTQWLGLFAPVDAAAPAAHKEP